MKTKTILILFKGHHPLYFLNATDLNTIDNTKI